MTGELININSWIVHHLLTKKMLVCRNEAFFVIAINLIKVSYRKSHDFPIRYLELTLSNQFLFHGI